MPATLLPRRDVDTSMTYWKPESTPVVLDFTKPGAEDKYKELEARDDTHRTIVQDVRGREGDFSLERNGFTYVKDDIEGLDACTSEEEYEKLIVPATEKLIQKLTGAHKTVVFTSRIRNVSEDTNQRFKNRAPALSVHCDFTRTGASYHAGIVVPDAAELEKLSRGRILFFNIWRPLKTVTKDPLAVCDWSTVSPETDMIPIRFYYPEHWTEFGRWRFNDKHQWYYLSAQQPDEPLVFLQYDSQNPSGVMMLHSAFQDKEYLEGPPRQSIEIKIAAFVK